MSDAAAPLDMGGLDDQKAGAGVRQHTEMGHVPIVAGPVVGAVLAHRRHHDAVRQIEIGKFYR